MSDVYNAILTYFQRVSGYSLTVTVLQLLLIGLVVYLVMRFLKGTRGARLLKGAALLMGIVFIVIRLLPKTDEWQRIEFLYGQFLWFALFALVVAFQPELRRALISIGQARLFRSRHHEMEVVIDNLIRSASQMARNKIGAIIAIERSVGLGALTETGTILDASVTAELLNTIFYPGSPLHDMGVIIHENRIAAAGCQFPIAESDEVDASLGSRHRAALGLSHDSDAVVLVVSEETGRISLAYGGQLHIGIETESLREMLLMLLAEAAKKRRKTPREANV
jgi:diadenylate cyclase